jgi:hypothetical protein
MKLKPKKWTHHHVRRLYHISRLVTFLVITLVIFTGLVTSWFDVSADSHAFPPSGISVTAVVPGVEEVPSTTTPPTDLGGAVGLLPPSVPGMKVPQIGIRAPLNLIVLISPGQSFKKLIPQGQSKPLELNVVTNSQPTVLGTVDIPGVFIYLELVGDNQVFNTGAYTDSKGNWKIKIPGKLTKGFYFLKVIAQDPLSASNTQEKDMSWYFQPNKSESIPTTVPTFPSQTPSGANSWLVTVINPGDKKISSGSTVHFQTLIHNDGNLSQPVKVFASLLDSQGERIFETENDVVIKNTITISKSWRILPSMEPGVYTINVRVEQGSLVLNSQDNFELGDYFHVGLGTDSSTPKIPLPYLIVTLATLLILIVWYEYRKILAVTSLIKQKRIS